MVDLVYDLNRKIIQVLICLLLGCSLDAEAKKVPLDNSDTCYASVMLREAASDPPEAQDAVANVLKERTLETKLSPCEELKLRGFAWARGQKNLNLRKFEVATFDKLRKKAATLHTRPSKVKGRKFFNKPRTGKKFKTPYKPVQIGSHIFY